MTRKTCGVVRTKGGKLGCRKTAHPRHPERCTKTATGRCTRRRQPAVARRPWPYPVMVPPGWLPPPLGRPVAAAPGPRVAPPLARPPTVARSAWPVAPQTARPLGGAVAWPPAQWPVVPSGQGVASHTAYAQLPTLGEPQRQDEWTRDDVWRNPALWNLIYDANGEPTQNINGVPEYERASARRIMMDELQIRDSASDKLRKGQSLEANLLMQYALVHAPPTGQPIQRRLDTLSAADKAQLQSIYTAISTVAPVSTNQSDAELLSRVLDADGTLHDYANLSQLYREMNNADGRRAEFLVRDIQEFDASMPSKIRRRTYTADDLMKYTTFRGPSGELRLRNNNLDLLSPDIQRYAMDLFQAKRNPST